MSKESPLKVNLNTNITKKEEATGNIGVSTVENTNFQGINNFSIDTRNLLKFSAREDSQYARKWIDSYAVLRQF